METPIKYSVDASVAKIILNRPDKYNSVNRQMAMMLQNSLDQAANDKSIRSIYLSGEGKAFCAGQDLAEAIDPSPGAPDVQTIVREHYNPIIKRIRSIEKPVVCVVNGVAAGAGANIAFACDIIVAAQSASFIQSFAKIGLVPDSGGTFFLPRLVGFQKASALMLTGDKIGAVEALQLGLIYKVVEDDKLADAAMNLCTMLAGMPTKGLGLTKRLLNASFFNTLEKQLELEEDIQGKAAKTYDYSEGVKAFLEKRKAEFRGE